MSQYRAIHQLNVSYPESRMVQPGEIVDLDEADAKTALAFGSVEPVSVAAKKPVPWVDYKPSLEEFKTLTRSDFEAKMPMVYADREAKWNARMASPSKPASPPAAGQSDTNPQTTAPVERQPSGAPSKSGKPSIGTGPARSAE